MLRSLRNDSGDGNDNGRRQKKNFARVSRVFVHFFAVVARLQRETSYFLVCGGREHNITVFFFFF